MYADRYLAERRFSPAGLAGAIAINAAVVAALMVAAPMVTAPKPGDTPFETRNIPIEPVPPPDPAPLQKAPPRPTQVDAPPPPIPVPPVTEWTTAPQPLPTDFAIGGAATTGDGDGPAVTATPTPAPPVIVAPSIDPRYAADFQPLYPASEQRLGNTGKVTVRVLIGTDGRIRQVERVSAASDAFYRATEQQALRRWRFRPGTRDGVPQEVWRTMTVTFVIAD